MKPTLLRARPVVRPGDLHLDSLRYLAGIGEVYIALRSVAVAGFHVFSLDGPPLAVDREDRL